MASSSVGSDIFAFFALLIISLLVLLLLRYYLPLRTTPAYLLVPIFLALALPCSIICLVPIDLASSSGADDGTARGIWLPDRVMLVSWRITYWLTFALTWLILPLLGEYADSGYREPKERFLYSLRSNARYQAMYLGSGIVGAVYFILQSGFDFHTLKSLVMALAYAWGLVLAIYLMGHGLVAFPRRLFRNADNAARLRRIQSHAPKIHDKLTEALDELDEIEVQVMQLRQKKRGLNRDYQDWIDELLEASTLPEARIPSATVPTGSRTSGPNVITDRYLADLGRKLKRSRHKKARFVDEWDRLVQEAADIQAIVDASASKKLDFGRASPYASLLGRVTLLTTYTRYLVYAHGIPAIRYAASGFLALASAAIVWSEIIKPFKHSLSIVGYTVVHHPSSLKGEVGFAGEVIAGLWLCYMCTAALFSVTEVKVWGNRKLVRRQTYAESACWYALQVAKLTVPLSYNFITFMPERIYRETTFYHFLGSLINLTPLGSGFSAYFPIFILLPVCATLFNLYSKVKDIVGFGGMIDEDEDDNPSGIGTGGWREGRTLIERELHGREQGLGLDNRAPTLSAGLGVQSPRRGLSPQPASRTTDPPPSRTLGTTVGAASAPRQQRYRDIEEGMETEEGGNFFSDLGRRMKNTVETNDLFKVEFNFKRPKWMGGDDEEAGAGGGEGSNFGRWFGGRSPTGRVRL